MTREIIYRLLLLLASMMGLIKFKKINLVFRLLTFYLLYTFLSESISLMLALRIHNNSLVQKIFFPVEVTFMCGMYYMLFVEKILKRIAIVFSALLLLAALIFFTFNPQALMPSYLITAESLILIGFSILYFFQLIKNPTESQLLTSGEFWLNSSILVYSTGSFIFWVTFYYLYLHKVFIPGLMVILFVLNMLQCLMMALSIFLDSKKAKTVMHGNGP